MQTFFNAIITRYDLHRLYFLFANTKPRLPYAGRTEGKHSEMGEVFHHSHGRYHRAIFGTNGFSMDLEVSCKIESTDSTLRGNNGLVWITLMKGKAPHSYHMTATPYKGQLDADNCDKLTLKLFPQKIVMEFAGAGKLRQFSILKKDIAVGRVQGNGPVDILWADTHRYDYRFVYDEALQKIMPTEDPENNLQ